MKNTKAELPPSIGNLRIEEFSYDLPPERIASFPLEQRDHSRMLVTRGNKISEARFEELRRFLPAESLLVLNNTKVVQARLEFFKPSGARIEIFCLQPLKPITDMHQILELPSPVHWQCLVGNAKKWKQGMLSIENPAMGLRLFAQQISRKGEEFEIAFSWEPSNLSFGGVLEMVGQTPLPPYITRRAEKKDKIFYQTVYAKDEGSVAAPTAGLHFTTELFGELEKKNIAMDFLTLHVGAGTFKPVSTITIGRHAMHSEQFLVKRELVETLIKYRNKITAVGTTSMRTLESVYWLGVKLSEGYKPENGYVRIEQWEPYYGGKSISAEESLSEVMRFLDKQGLDEFQGDTSLIIVPGYYFQLVDLLITNFHQPRSTLLLLVAAFVGPAWKDAYEYALEKGFRFLSYGDSCLFFRNVLL